MSPAARDRGPDIPGADRRPLADHRLEEIRRRVAQKFYDGDPVLMEVADAVIQHGIERRARGDTGRSRPIGD